MDFRSTASPELGGCSNDLAGPGINSHWYLPTSRQDIEAAGLATSGMRAMVDSIIHGPWALHSASYSVCGCHAPCSVLCWMLTGEA